MAFTPKTLDGVAAWKRALASGTARPGYCLAEVHQAFGSPQSDRVFPYANATEARVRAKQLKAIDGYDLDDAPEGAVLYWSNVIVKGKDLGHIAFKGPNNTIVTIDNPTRGRWGQVTVAAFRKKWGWLKFEGYAYGPGAYLGHTVTVATDLKPVEPSAPASTPVAPATPTHPNKLSTGDTVFIAKRKGSWYLIIPNGGKQSAIPLGQNDKTIDVPQVEFATDRAWDVLKQCLTNPGIVVD